MSRNKKTSESLFQFMNLLIALLLKNGQYRTSLHYKATLNSFKRYRDNKDIALKEIDAEEMRSYEAYLHHTAKVCSNTSSFYLRILRATYNKAVAKGLTPQQHPFNDVYTGIAQTSKRAIPAESVSQIKRLHSVKELTPNEEMARDTFLMSFYLRGISFIDLAHLRKSDLKDGYLHYIRSKTGQRLTIRWEKEMQDLLEKYQAQTLSSPYLFPFLVNDGNKSQDKSVDKMQEEVRLYHDYVVIGQYSQDQLTINSLKGRGSDGDYSIKEMDEKLNVPQSIKRLYESVVKHADGKKGIVYAIDIDHAQMIAAYYKAMGIKAVALDSKTPAKTRQRMVEAFRKGELDCMVNVNLFDEGFDCPDVEYIQMARPTLSLAKYLQMVGRGLRINHKQKDKVCMIIDNVGNYRKFGLPDRERNWSSMYAGLRAGKGTIPPSAKKTKVVIVPNNDMVFVAQYNKKKAEQSSKQRYEYLQGVKPFEESGRWGLRVGDDIILQPVYRKIHDFIGGFAVFEIAPNRVGILIRNGKVYYPADYQEIKILSGNRALLTQNVIHTEEVKLDAKWGYQ